MYPWTGRVRFPYISQTRRTRTVSTSTSVFPTPETDFSKEALDAIENDTPIIYHGRHHVGISNIKRRLALMYGERASITCSNMDEKLRSRRRGAAA